MTHSFGGMNDYYIMLILLVPLRIAFITYSCFKSDFGDLERPRSPGDDLENAQCGDSVYHEDELE